MNNPNYNIPLTNPGSSSRFCSIVFQFLEKFTNPPNEGLFFLYPEL